jgi:hypothetical protein
MQTTQHGWQIIDGDAGVLSLSYKFASEGQANCFTAKLPSGGLMVISPPSRWTEAQIGDLAAYGEVEAIVANNGYHHEPPDPRSVCVPCSLWPGPKVGSRLPCSSAGKTES